MRTKLSKSELAGYIIAAVVVVFFAACVFSGCDKPSGQPEATEAARPAGVGVITLPPGSTFETETTREVSGGSRIAVSEGSGKSTGLATSSDQVAGSYKAESPTSSFESSGGGGVSFDLKIADSRVKLNWFHLVGGIMVVGSVAAFFMLKGTKSPSIVLMACGLTSILVGSLLAGSVWAYMVVLVVVAALIGWYLWTAKGSEQVTKALQAVTSAVDKAEVREQVGPFVKAAAGSDIRAVDRQIEKAKSKTKG